MDYPSIETLRANPFLAIITGHTCGEACWHAREEICRCSCGGQNHGILNRGGERPQRCCKIDGNFYELVAVIPGRGDGECWHDVFKRTDAALNEVLADRFPHLDRNGYGSYRPESTVPAVDRKVSATQAKWAEVIAVPNAARLIWARPAGTRYLVRAENPVRDSRGFTQYHVYNDAV